MLNFQLFIHYCVFYYLSLSIINCILLAVKGHLSDSLFKRLQECRWEPVSAAVPEASCSEVNMAAGKPLIIVLRMTFLTLPVFTVEIALCPRAGASSEARRLSRRFED